MPFQIHLDILDWVFKGMLIGIVVSAPMGPVGVLCVQRTLSKGRWFGFATGVGAAVSDLFYALITGFGMSFIANLIDNPQNRFGLQIAGSIMLMCFGIYTFRTKRIRTADKPLKRGEAAPPVKKGAADTLVYNGITAFLVTVSNPLIIFLFIACFAQFAFVANNNPLEMSVGYLSIIAGALLWWFGLTWLINKVRKSFKQGGIIIINRIIGSIVIIVSVIMILGTMFNLYIL